MKPFTIIRGGLHPDEKPAKPAKKEKFNPYQLQLIARLRKEIRADWTEHAKRYWGNQIDKTKYRDRLAMEKDHS